LRVITDVNGTVVKRIDYDAFGNIITDSNPSFEIPFGFAGGLHDRDTGLVRFGFRDYDSETGRWTAKDPIMFLSGQTDVYGYTFSDPVNFVDPEGLQSACETTLTATLTTLMLVAVYEMLRSSSPWDYGNVGGKPHKNIIINYNVDPENMMTQDPNNFKNFFNNPFLWAAGAARIIHDLWNYFKFLKEDSVRKDYIQKSIENSYFKAQQEFQQNPPKTQPVSPFANRA